MTAARALLQPEYDLLALVRHRLRMTEDSRSCAATDPASPVSTEVSRRRP